MVRPSLASLNSLAEVLRRAQPVYDECRFIINCLDQAIEADSLSPAKNECATSAPIRPHLKSDTT